MDMKTAMAQIKPRLSLPQKPAPAPAAAQTPPKAKPVEPLGPAEQLVHDAIRDGHPVTFAFTDGTAMTAAPTSIGKYSFRVRTDDGRDIGIFKTALKYVAKEAGATE